MYIKGLLNKFTQLFTLISFDEVLLRKVHSITWSYASKHSGRTGLMDVCMHGLCIG